MQRDVKNNYLVMTLLEQLPEPIRKDVRILGRILNGNYRYAKVEDREASMNLLKEHISDIVLTILIQEDKDKLEIFLGNNKK